MEEIIRFVMLAQSGRFTVSELCEQFGISRKTGYKHLERYAADGLKGLAVRSHRPHQFPQRTDAAVEALILAERRLHRTWGPKKLHKVFGHLFSGRYKALIVDGRGSGYLKTVCDYVHLNPARAKLLTPEQPLSAYRWSSWPEYLKRPAKRWPWLRVERLLGEYRIAQDSAAGRRVLAQALEERRLSEAGADYQAIRRGWCLGDETFRKELLAQMSERRGAEHYGAERLETDVARAERILGEELKRRRWAEADLAKRAKGDLGKVKIAGRLREETLMTVKWIAARLGMGTAGYVNNRLYRWRKGTLA